MEKLPGFSLIELMVTMAIAGILAGIAVPNVQRWQAKDKFKSQATQVFQMLDSARNNAMAEKKCPNGNLSVGWEFEITSDEFRTIRVNCDDGTKKEMDEAFTFDPFIEIAENSITIPWTSDGTPQNTIIAYFFSGSVTPRIGTSFNNASFRVPLTSSRTQLEKTLCLNRVSGIPSLTDDKNCE